MTNLALLLLHLLVVIVNLSMIMHSATAFTFARICRVYQPANFTVLGSRSSQRAAFFSYRTSRYPLQLQFAAQRQQHGQTTVESSNNDGDAANDAELKNINHRKYYSISGIGQRSSVTMETNTGHNLQTDVPKKMGGSDKAPQPVEHLLAALLGCTQATAIYVGRMMNPRLLIDKIEFDVEAYRDERGALQQPIDELPAIPARLQQVSGTVKVHFKKGIRVSEEQLRVLGEQTEARCPVANMMHASGCVMDMKWINNNN